MWTSKRIVLVEAAAAAALVVGFVMLASPHDVWLQRYGLHPVWIPVIVLAARYAIAGLFPALALSVGGLAAADLVTGGTLHGLTVRAGNVSDLLALTTSVLVAWVAMAHASRTARAHDKLADASDGQRHAEDNVRALHASLDYLRKRHDRLDISLSLWRNLAGRLERGEAPEAARAVLELCEIRTGARAGIVHLADGERLSSVAVRGPWSTAGLGDDVAGDPTMRAAIRTRQVTPATRGASETDADVAVPVVDDESGAVVGVIALRGVSPGAMRAADLRDLAVLAQWLSPALARQLRKRFRKAFGQLWAVPRAKSEVSL